MLAGLRKHYGDVHAVAGLDLVIAPGEVVALLGRNGAGKSTTVDMLLGLTRPDAGTVTVFGATPHEAVATGAIGAMLQGGALLDDATHGRGAAGFVVKRRRSSWSTPCGGCTPVCGWWTPRWRPSRWPPARAR